MYMYFIRKMCVCALVGYPQGDSDFMNVDNQLHSFREYWYLQEPRNVNNIALAIGTGVVLPPLPENATIKCEISLHVDSLFD